MINFLIDIESSREPLIAAAIHNGHGVRKEVAKYLAVDEFERLHEEDPYTNVFTDIGTSRIVNFTSRFEIDVNRPPEKAIYKEPGQAWGMRVWKGQVPDALWIRSYQEYDYFYSRLDELLTGLVKKYGFVVIYDIHTYNYKRTSRDKEDNPLLNPEINVGTGTMDRQLWDPVVAHFIKQLSAFDYFGRPLDVRENVKFEGGYFSEWVHRRFLSRACVLAVEFKKFFMDEWTGAVDIQQLKELRKALQETVPGVLRRARQVKRNIHAEGPSPDKGLLAGTIRRRRRLAEKKWHK